jgi:hypothetical protein
MTARFVLSVVGRYTDFTGTFLCDFNFGHHK